MLQPPSPNARSTLLPRYGSSQHASDCSGRQVTWAFRPDLGRDRDGRRLQRRGGGYVTRRKAERTLREFLAKVGSAAYLEDFLIEEWLPRQHRPAGPHGAGPQAGMKSVGSGRKIDLAACTAGHRGRGHDSFLFTWPGGRHLHPDWISTEVTRLCELAGVPVIRAHDTRHTHASLLLASGEHLKVVQERLGCVSSAQPPLRWSTESDLEDLLGHGVRSTDNRPRTARQYYHSVEHAVEVFSSYFGPTLRALEAVDASESPALLADLAAVFDRYDRADDGTAVVVNSYLQTIAVRA